MFWQRKVQVTQKDREIANALYADIITFGKRSGPALAATPKPRPAAQAREPQPDAPAHGSRYAQPHARRTTVLRILREDGEHHQIKFGDLAQAVRQARILHGCGYEVLIHHRMTNS
jgi:hypothetical protein